MRYMMLIHHDETALANAPQKELWADYAAFNEALAKAGSGMSAGERLQPASAATTVRSAGDKTDVLDGPYADTKEQLAGYFLIDVPDLEEAIVWAKRCPSSRYGSIEIRPLATTYPRPDPSLRGQGS
ncbi:MAG: YciI family protein [Devosia sp.]|uniref:YciI family protein n=1 Tax=Devosia sp. TaxID=1871048 RepID=UPI00260F10B6|nr:YciI family protein [Devosia sp.]MDB5538757.1 YciI family protein [Devosia sp.]